MVAASTVARYVASRLSYLVATARNCLSLLMARSTVLRSR